MPCWYHAAEDGRFYKCCGEGTSGYVGCVPVQEISREEYESATAYEAKFLWVKKKPPAQRPDQVISPAIVHLLKIYEKAYSKHRAPSEKEAINAIALFNQQHVDLGLSAYTMLSETPEYVWEQLQLNPASLTENQKGAVVLGMNLTAGMTGGR